MKRIAAIGIIVLTVAIVSVARAQYTVDFQTNIISGVTSNWTGDYIIGNSTFGDVLRIINGGVLSGSDSGWVGYEAGGTGSNIALISGPGSAWNNAADLYVGGSGAGNSLTISNGGAVYNAYGVLGHNNSSSNNSVLVNDPGSVWNNSADIYVGESGAGNSLTISNGGAVYDYYGLSGLSSSANNNSILVTGGLSIWNNYNGFNLGYSGAGNSLTISKGGKVYTSYCALGVNGSSSNNSVLVSGPGSVCSNSGNLHVGVYGAGNSLTISNGGVVYDYGCLLGLYSSSSNNSVLVTSPGSVWSNRFDLYVGFSGSGNSLTISNGGSAVANNAYVDVSPGGTGNRINVTGGSFYIANSLGNGALRIGDGTLFFNNGIITVDSLIATFGAKSIIVFNGGTLTARSAFVTNGQDFVIGNTGSDATYVALVGTHSFNNNLVVQQGNLVLTGGTITANQLILTNGANSAFAFSSGQLNSGGTAVTNTQQFAVGDGASAATFHLLSGVHSFNNGLRIRNNATLSGCGTINGNVIVDAGGTVLADCSPLVFGQGVTNNGTLRAFNGATLESYGPVVNYGVIDVISGNTNFHSTLINNGIMLSANADNDGDGQSNLQEYLAGTDPTNSASAFRILSVVATNNDVLVTWATAGGRTNVVLSATDLTVGYTNLSPNIILPGSGAVTTNYLDAGAATNSASRFYRIRLVP